MTREQTTAKGRLRRTSVIFDLQDNLSLWVEIEHVRGWLHAYLFVFQDGLIELAELRIFPKEPALRYAWDARTRKHVRVGDRDFGTWSGDPRKLRKGRLTATIARQAQPGLALRVAIERFREAPFRPPKRLQDAEPGSRRGTRTPEHRDDLLALIAVLYDQAQERSGRAVELTTGDLKDYDYHFARSTVRDKIRQARKCGLLEATEPRRAGGRATPEAHRIALAAYPQLASTIAASRRTSRR